MTTSAPPFVECDKTFAGLAVSDVSAAVEFYTTQLGFKVGFTWGGPPPTFAGVNLGKWRCSCGKGRPIRRGAACTFTSATRTCSTNFIAPKAPQLRKRSATGNTECETTLYAT